ncbi:GSCOCG00004940001-RA-CDS [Cotesia congregata]|nr:GSCOCG00004940001-RA-CDS [Cotesia congregata]
MAPEPAINGHQLQFNCLANGQSNREPATQRPVADVASQSGIESTKMQFVYPQAQSSFNQSVVNQGLPVSAQSSITSFSTSNTSNSLNLTNRPVNLPRSDLHYLNNFQTFNNRVPTLNQCTYTVPIRDQSSYLQTQVKPVQQVKDWQLSLSEEKRKENVNCLIEAIFTNGHAESIFDDRLNHLLNYAQKAENEIYNTANSEVEYSQLLVDKIISSRIEIEDRRRKREIVANQSHIMASDANLPPAPIGITTTAESAEVSDNLQPATLNGNQPLDIPLGLRGLDQATPTQVVKEWHQSLTLDLRIHFIIDIVKRILTPNNRMVFFDDRVHNSYRYAIKVERDMYESANSRSEYMHLLAEKIYSITKGLEERRQKREQLQSASQQSLQQSVVDNLGLRIPGPSMNVQANMPPQIAGSYFPNRSMMPGPYHVMPTLP